MIPNQAIEQQVKDNGLLKYNVEKLFTDIVDKKIHQTQPQQEADRLDMDEIMEDIQQPLNIVTGQEVEMNSRYFKLQARESVKRYTFRKKYIHVFFNMLVNFIA